MSAGVSAVGSVISSAMDTMNGLMNSYVNLHDHNLDRIFNDYEAQKQRDWQERP